MAGSDAVPYVESVRYRRPNEIVYHEGNVSLKGEDGEWRGTLFRCDHRHRTSAAAITCATKALRKIENERAKQ